MFSHIKDVLLSQSKSLYSVRMRKMRIRKTPNMNTFQAVILYLKNHASEVYTC